MKRLLRLAMLPLVAQLCSCAAMFTGTSTDIYFTSDPPNQVVKIGEQTVTTPGKLTVSKSLDMVSFTVTGQPPVEAQLDSSFQGGFLLLDLLFTPGFGTVGLLVDGLSDAWWRYPTTVHFDARDRKRSLGLLFPEPPTSADPGDPGGQE